MEQQASFKHVTRIGDSFAVIVKDATQAEFIEAALEADHLAMRDEVAELIVRLVCHWHSGKLPTDRAGIQQLAADLVKSITVTAADTGYHRDFVARYGRIDLGEGHNDRDLAA